MPVKLANSQSDFSAIIISPPILPLFALFLMVHRILKHALVIELTNKASHT
jgi:hypothetical protein